LTGKADLFKRPLPSRRAFRKLLSREFQEQPQRPVDGGRIGKGFGHIWVKNDDVRGGLVGEVVVAAHAAGEVVLRA
jgi:hypothetical protein